MTLTMMIVREFRAFEIIPPYNNVCQSKVAKVAGVIIVMIIIISCLFVFTHFRNIFFCSMINATLNCYIVFKKCNATDKMGHIVVELTMG